MRISRIRIRVRAAFAASLLVLLSGLAPAAAAQPLATIQGSSIGYRVDLPAGWEKSGGDDMLMVGRGDVIISVSATDLVALQKTPQPVSVAEQRRIYTQRFMDSDSAMMALMAGVAERLRLEPDGRMLEVRTLGGQRAAYVRGRPVQNRALGSSQAYLTVKDGILYLLSFIALDNNPGRHQDLFDRVHQSFVLAEAPPS